MRGNPEAAIPDVGRWAQCEAMALHSPTGGRGAYPAAAWLHRLVKAKLVDLPDRAAPAMVAYSGDLPTAKHTERVAVRVALTARGVLADEGVTLWQPASGELPAQILGHRKGGVELCIELVTGHDIGAAWLRVASAGLGEKGDLLPAVLHAPHTRPGYATLETRLAEPVQMAYWALRDRWDAITTRNAPPLRTPGHHCRRCGLDCAVRPGEKA